MNRPAWVAWDSTTRTGYCVRCGGGLAALADDEPTLDAEHRSYRAHERCEVDQAEQNKIAEEQRATREKIAAIDKMERPRIVAPASGYKPKFLLDALNRGDEVVRHVNNGLLNYLAGAKGQKLGAISRGEGADPIVRQFTNPNAFPVERNDLLHGFDGPAYSIIDRHMPLGMPLNLDPGGALKLDAGQEFRLGYSQGHTEGFKAGRAAGLEEAKSLLQHQAAVERVEKKAKIASFTVHPSSALISIEPNAIAEIEIHVFVPVELEHFEFHPGVIESINVHAIRVGLTEYLGSYQPVLGTMFKDGFDMAGATIYPSIPLRVRVENRSCGPLSVSISARGKQLSSY